jgi:hypothetical protein
MTRLLQYLLSIVLQQRKIMSDLTDLQAAFAANTVAIDTAVAIHDADKATIATQAAHITDLQTQLDAANATIAAGGSTDGAALQAMTAQLTLDDARLPTSTGAVAT